MLAGLSGSGTRSELADWLVLVPDGQERLILREIEPVIGGANAHTLGVVGLLFHRGLYEPRGLEDLPWAQYLGVLASRPEALTAGTLTTVCGVIGARATTDAGSAHELEDSVVVVARGLARGPIEQDAALSALASLLVRFGESALRVFDTWSELLVVGLAVAETDGAEIPPALVGRLERGV